MGELISVIVPVYNVEKYLVRCLESLMHQSYTELEMILVDDGSTDQSGAIIEEYLKKDSRFIAVRKENGGLSDARNAGIDIAKGKFLIFVDADDYVHHQFVELLYQAVISTEADIAVCEGVEVDEKNQGDTSSVIPLGYKTETFNAIDAMKFWYTRSFRNVTVAWNKIYRRELFAAERFEKGKFHEDEFIMHRIFMKAFRVTYIWAGLYFYYQRCDSITGSNTYSIKRLDVVEACDERWKIFRETGDTELEYLHVLQYMDVLLGCSVDIMEKYNGVDKKKYLDILKAKMIEISTGRKIAIKQKCKMMLYQYAPYLYLKIYRRVKG